MKRLLTFIIAAIIFFPCGAQSWEEIKSSRQYIYGEGWGSSDAEADKNALADLISKISVQVQSSFTLTEDELSHNGQVDGETYARSKVQTYSQATLTNTEKIVIEYEPDAHVGRYILKSEISRIFEARRRRIDEMLGLAETAEKNAKIDDALRYYYWAYAMLKTLQHPNEVRDSNNHLLSTWIPAQMNDIFDGIKVRPMRKTSDNVLEVAVTYKDKPVASYDYTYFDGQNWSNIYSAKDGRGVIELNPGAITDNLSNDTEYRKTIGKVLAAITAKDYAAAEKYFTPQGAEMFRSLINYGRARVLDTSGLTFYQNGDRVVCRNAKMSFSFRNGLRKSFVEDVVFTFDSKKRIDYIAFGLGEKAEHDILNNDEWNEATRKALMNFLENYKTAFALKRIDYLRNVFDDNAVIISGCVITPGGNRFADSNSHYAQNQYVRYTREGKNEYIARMARSFASKEFINIRFSDNSVKKLGKGMESYAIQIKQDYYSSNYGDTGYLFLYVDINDPENPIIKVRTWQPKPDPKFKLIDAGYF